MTVRDKAALSIPSLFLRLALGVVFILAGYSKIFSHMEIPRDQAVILANMGARVPTKASTPAPAPAPAEKPVETPPKPHQPAPADSIVAPEQPLPDPKTPVSNELDEAPRAPRTIDALWIIEDDADAAPAAQPGAGAPPAPKEAPPTTALKTYTADDFPEMVSIPSKLMIALVLHSAAHPAEGARPYWPAEWSRGKAPVYLAELAAWTELVAGALVLVGLLTRLASFSLFCTMAMAFWLTSVGPIVMGAPGVKSFLGLLPPPDNFLGWVGWQFQFTLAMAALGLVFGRAGALSLDGLLFPSPPEPPPKK